MTAHAPADTVSTAEAIELRNQDNSISRHRMRRAARIFAGKPNLVDRVVAIPDKGWLALIIAGTCLVAYALGCATFLVVGL